MHVTRTLVLCAALGVAIVAGQPHARSKRQLADDDSLQPLEHGTTYHHRHIRTPIEDQNQKSSITEDTQSISRQNPSSRSKGTISGLRLPRQTPTTADGIPIFDRNKVSLDFPGSLFGPSVSLLIKTTKIAGDVIQNSAVRYQSFLRLFRPLFRGPFEIKGLDPPTTTTTTTTTTEPPANNEVRRRRDT